MYFTRLDGIVFSGTKREFPSNLSKLSGFNHVRHSILWWYLELKVSNSPYRAPLCNVKVAAVLWNNCSFIECLHHRRGRALSIFVPSSVSRVSQPPERPTLDDGLCSQKKKIGNIQTQLSKVYFCFSWFCKYFGLCRWLLAGAAWPRSQ